MSVGIVYLGDIWYAYVGVCERDSVLLWSLNVCAMKTVVLYMIICYLVVCVISFDYCSNSLYFSPSLSSSL